MKNTPLCTTCSCLHAGMWHRPNCRIRACECQEFEHGVVKRPGDAAWLKKARTTPKMKKGHIE